jgi:hypothetical protein
MWMVLMGFQSSPLIHSSNHAWLGIKDTIQALKERNIIPSTLKLEDAAVTLVSCQVVFRSFAKLMLFRHYHFGVAIKENICVQEWYSQLPPCCQSISHKGCNTKL